MRVHVAATTNTLALKLGIVERADYTLVHQDVWDKLYSWYGGGPAFPRKVITIGFSVRYRLARCSIDSKPGMLTRLVFSSSCRN